MVMWCVVVTYKYTTYDTYDSDKTNWGYKLVFCNTNSECELKFDDSKKQILKNFADSIDEEIDPCDIEYDKYEIPEM